MTTRTVYLWGPMSSFSSELVGWFLNNGWTVHIPTKSALHVSLSPLDLRSSVQSSLDQVIGTGLKLLRDRLVMLDVQEIPRGTSYDMMVFCGLPPNFNEPRVSRAPWAADELKVLASKMKGVPIMIVSSLWAAIQSDGVVPEEIEFERRKPKSHFEALCQQYETKIQRYLDTSDSPWNLVRLPLVTGNLADGLSLGFSGISSLLEKLSSQGSGATVELAYNPDSTLWMLPADVTAELVGKSIEDGARPRIFNLVSTQARLNQEWLPDLAGPCGLNAVTRGEKDSVNLPGTLRSMLADNIQVRTRNLFEVLGRHRQAPIVMDSDYFHQLVEFGIKENWGHLRKDEPDEFDPEMAEVYFEEFLPTTLQGNLLKTVQSFKGGIAFSVGKGEHSWLLTADNMGAGVRALDPAADSPVARITIQPDRFKRLVENKMAFELALVTKAIQVENASAVQSFRALDFFRKFLKDNTFATANGDGGNN